MKARNEKMQPVRAKWQKSGLVMVCERCFKERIPEEDPEKAKEIGDFNLRDWLKEQLKANGEWGAIRVVSTSCMDICGKQRVTVAIDQQDPAKPVEIFVVDPVAEKQAVYDAVVERLGANARAAQAAEPPTR